MGTGSTRLFILMERVTRGLMEGMCDGGWAVSIPDGCSGFSSGLRAGCS